MHLYFLTQSKSNIIGIWFIYSKANEEEVVNRIPDPLINTLVFSGLVRMCLRLAIRDILIVSSRYLLIVERVCINWRVMLALWSFNCVWSAWWRRQWACSGSAHGRGQSVCDRISEAARACWGPVSSVARLIGPLKSHLKLRRTGQGNLTVAR